MVSVIIPTYKSWDSLQKCLEALSNQTYSQDYEIIVVNNDKGEVPTILFKYSNVFFSKELMPGSYAARNKGILEAKGDIIAFTDADCIPRKDWLKNGVELLISTKCGIVAGDVKLFFKDPEKLTIAEIYDKYTGFNQKGYVSNGNCITANWFSYKSVLEEFGGFDSKLKSNGDSDLSGRISKKYPILFAENTIVYHPARYTVDNIIVKYRRLMGGTYDRLYKGTDKKFSQYIRSFIFRRIKFNLNLVIKFKIKDATSVFRVHKKLFPALIKEYYKIIKTGQTERL